VELHIFTLDPKIKRKKTRSRRFTKRTLEESRKKHKGPPSSSSLQLKGLAMEVESAPDLAGDSDGLDLARIIGWLSTSDLELQRKMDSLLQENPSPLLLRELSLAVATSAPRKREIAENQQRRAPRIRRHRTKKPSSLLSAPARDEERKP